MKNIVSSPLEMPCILNKEIIMKELILNIFYNKIIKEARNNSPVDVNGWKFFVDFDTLVEKEMNTQANNDIVLTIKDKRTFDNVLTDYTVAMINHLEKYQKLHGIDAVYHDGNLEKMIESALVNVWFNATEEDFKDPVNFLRIRKDFLEDDLSIIKYNIKYKSSNIALLNSNHIEATIDIQNPSAHETPFVFKSRICNDNNETYQLPNISYGISNGKCYIYAIQGDKPSELNTYHKKVNRLLYRANKNFNFDYEEENIKDVSSSQLFSLTIFLKMLEQNNINELIVKNNFPIRYNAKEKLLIQKINKLKEKLESSSEYDKNIRIETNKMIEDNDLLYQNIINKYLRIFRRIEYHFSNVNITSFPYELDNNMHIKLTEYNDFSNDHILNSVYENMNFKTGLTKK